MDDSTILKNDFKSFTKEEFKKVYYHLCLAAKKQLKIEKKEKNFSHSENKIIQEKIETLEKKEHIPHDNWIKDKLEKTELNMLTPKSRIQKHSATEFSKKVEIEEIKKHILEANHSYDALKHNKSISKEKLKALKNRIENLEKILKHHVVKK